MRRANLLAALIVPTLLWPQRAAADDPDAAALALADHGPAAVEHASDWRSFFEADYGGYTRRAGGSVQQAHRASLDVRYDSSFAAGWRAVLADRLDAAWPAQVTDQYAINTFKDGYLSWQPRADTIVDAGRINVHQGVAYGYDPTDYLRGGAVRTAVSVDPASLKENRQGSVMLRAQRLWDGGSLTTLYAPKLSDQFSAAGLNPDLGATNHDARWLLTLSQRIGADISPQLLLFKEADLPPQLGLNLTGLVNAGTVVYAEWSGGRSPSLLSQALRRAAGLPYRDDSAWRQRLAVGTTYTTNANLSLTAELEYNGAGLDAASWDGLYRRGPRVYAAYRNWLLFVRDLPTRRAAFFLGRWQDAALRHLDLSVMKIIDAVDRSRLSWVELRYHFDRVETALQWQRDSGSAARDFGAAPQLQIGQALLRYYF